MSWTYIWRGNYGYWQHSDEGSGGTGPKGDPGLSAYQVAVANGFVGTEQQWLDSLTAKVLTVGDFLDTELDILANRVTDLDTRVGTLTDRVTVLEGGVPEPEPDPEPEPEPVFSFTDLFTGTDGNPWDTGKWTVSTVLEGAETGIADIQSNHGRLRTTGNADSSTEPIVRAIANVVDADHSDIDLLLTGITYGAGPTSDRWFGVFIRASGDWQGTGLAPTTGYRVLFGRNGSVNLHRHDNGSASEAALGSSTWTPTQNTNLRIQAVGSAIKVRIWEEGTSEPSTWAIEATDATHASGTVQLVTFCTGTATTATDWLIDQIEATAEAAVEEPEPPGPPPAGFNMLTNPSAFGYPDETNTGLTGVGLTAVDLTTTGTLEVRDPDLLENGIVRLTRPGSGSATWGPVTMTPTSTVIDLAHVQGRIIQKSSHSLLVKRSWVEGQRTNADSSNNTVNTQTKLNWNTATTTLEDCLIDGGWDKQGVAGGLITIRRCNIFGGEDNVILSSFVHVSDSYLHDVERRIAGHADNLQTNTGNTASVTHCTILSARRMPDGQGVEFSDGWYDPMNGVYMVGNNNGPVHNVLFENNLVDGGNYTFNANWSKTHARSGIVVRNNRFGRHFRFGPRSSDLFAGVVDGVWEGNVWDDTGEPV